MNYGQIYAEFLQYCLPAPLPQPWGRFMETADFWRPPRSEKATLAVLRKNHSTKHLLGSGIVTRNQRKDLELNPIFTGTSDAILPLRDSPQSNPFDLLTEQGTVSGRLPIHTAVADYVVLEAIQEKRFLCITFSMSDMMSLRAVGMPTALASGLAQFTPNSLEEFHKCVGFSIPGLAAFVGPGTPPPSAPSTHLAQEEDAYEMLLQSVNENFPGTEKSHPSTTDSRGLILTGWTPSQLSNRRPQGLDQVIDNIVSAGSCLGVALEDVLLWQPTTREIHALARCQKVGSKADVVQAILSNIDQSANPLAPSKNRQESSIDILKTGARLRKSLLSPESSPAQRRRALRDFQRAVDDLFVNPYLDRAAADPQLMTRSRLAGLAQVNRLLHPSVMLHLARLEKEISRNGLRGDGKALDIRGLLKLFDVLGTLSAVDS